MLKIRVFILSLAFVLGSVWIVWSQEETGWQHWQTLFHQTQADLAKDAKEKQSWLDKPLEIKQSRVTARIGMGKNRAVSDLKGNTKESCLTCHDGIEPMSASHPATFGCTVCHGGDADSVDKKEAHASMIFDPAAGTGKRNPSALSVVHLSCGQAGCHAGHADTSRNQVHRIRRSMMGTLSGVIAGLRYQWSAQSTPEARYGVSRVPADSEQSGDVVPPQKPDLEKLPFFLPKDRAQQVVTGRATGTEKVSRHPADGVLRSICFQCHLDGQPAQGDYRSQGCAACHVSYSREGTYEGLDPTIPKQAGHMRKHKLTALPEQATCTTCHKSQAAIEENPPGQSADWRKNSMIDHPVQDVHVRAGMECIDCHSSFDVMGDGSLHSRQYEAVEIACETCHGTATRHPKIEKVTSEDTRLLRENSHYSKSPVKEGDWSVVSRLGRKLSNVKVHKGKMTVFSKRSKKSWEIPLIKDGRTHRIKNHNEKLACNACHSSWVPQCKGCHLTFNSQKADHQWSGFRAETDFRQPALLIGPDSRVRPASPMPLNTLTALDAKGHPLAVINDEGDAHGHYRDFAFTNPKGYSGANSLNAMHPHSVGTKVRSCASCHLSGEALGLGPSNIEIGRKASGKRDQADSVIKENIYGTLGKNAPLPKGTLRGQTVAGSHQPGTRAFNQEELNRILKVGSCLPCHNRQSDRIYKNIEQSYRLSTTKKHRARIKKAREAF